MDYNKLIEDFRKLPDTNKIDYFIKNIIVPLEIDDTKNASFNLNNIFKELYTLYPQVSTTTIRDIINFKTWKNLI